MRDDLFTFTGTLADGSAFIFTNQAYDRLVDVTLSSVDLPTRGTTPILVDAASPLRPSGLRAGQTLTLTAGGVLGNNFEAVDATLNIAGGSLGEAAGVSADSVVNVSGGTVGRWFSAYSGSVINISGGTFYDYFAALPGSVINISGGTLGRDFDAHPGSQVNLIGTEFFLEGASLDGLVLGEPFLISKRDVELTGMHPDGSLFKFNLNAFKLVAFGPSNYFSDYATVTVTLVSSGLPGDYNGDGTVDAADYTVWRNRQGDAVALINETVTPGRVTLEDYDVWAANFGAVFLAAESNIPEPASLTLLCLSAIPGVCLRRRNYLA